MPLLEVSFAPGVASSAVPGALDWVDITERVSSWAVKYGREDEFGQPSAGTMDLELDSHDGMFDPDAAGSPYAGQLLPLTWFRARGGAASVDTDLFYGQVSIEGWRLSASQFSGRMAVNVTVVDMLEQLANTDLPGSVYEIEVQADDPVAWYRLSESSGTVATDSSGNAHHGSYLGGATFNSRSSLIANSTDNAIEFDGVDDMVQVPEAVAPDVSTSFSVEAWFQTPAGDTAFGYIYTSVPTDLRRNLLLVNGAAPGALAFQVRPTAGSTDVVRVSAPSDVYNDGAPHHVVATWDGSTSASLYADGVLVATSSALVANAVVADPGTAIGASLQTGDPGDYFHGTIDEFAVYNSSLSAGRVATHYAAGTAPGRGERTDERVTRILDGIDFPVALRSIATGDSTVQAATFGTDALSALRDVATTEGGVLYVDHHDGGKVRFDNRHYRWTDTESITSQATFGDAAGEVTYSTVALEDDRIVNVASVQRSGGATITVEDAASVTQYQRRTFSESGLLFESDAEASSRASMIVAEKKDRHRRVRSVTLEPADPAHPAWPEVFARRIGDRVTVKWRPPYGGTYSFPAYVEGVQHSWVPASSSPWRSTFSLSPVPYGATGAPYWILGESVLEVDTRIGA